MGLSDQCTIDAISKDHVAWLATLLATLALQDDVFLCHGTPQDDLTDFLEEVTKEGVREASLQMVTARAEGCTPRASLDPTVNPSSSIPYGQTKGPEPQPRLLSTRQPDYRAAARLRLGRIVHATARIRERRATATSMRNRSLGQHGRAWLQSVAPEYVPPIRFDRLGVG